jgi:membrane fusion protein (multidrug efflux system)
MTSNNRTILSILTLAILLTGCGKNSDGDSKNPTDPAIPVHTVIVTEEEVTPVLEYSGTVEPWAEAALGSEIPGRIEHLHCDVGDTVQAGFLIAELGSETLIQVQANFDATEKDWNRIKSLRESGTVSQQTYDRTQAAFDASKATYEKTLASTQLRAPFSGVITQKYLEEGEVFTLMPGAAGSPAIVRLMFLDTVKVAVAVTENQYHNLALGQNATLKLDAYPDKEFVGIVSRIDPTINTQTRTANVEIQFVNSSEIIKPGMFGVVKISLPSKDVLLVNRDALIKQEGTGIFYVFKVQNDTASRANVITGDYFGGLVEITSGLEDGDTVVTTGKMKIKTGSIVQIASAEVTK